MKQIPGPLAVFMAGFVLGALICALGLVEVGDGLYFYLLSLVIAGAVAALPSPRWFWLTPFSILAGQVIYMYVDRPFKVEGYAIVGLIYGAMYALVALPGALFTFLGWSLGRKEKRT